MARHKLSLSADYVADWDSNAAIRELFQNFVDHGDWSYDIVNSTLTLVSNNAALHASTLLLGNSSKREGSIGKFGEGYKLAALVLTRLGYEFYVDTANEHWKASLINSRTYGTRQLVFDVSKKCEVSADITFTVVGVTAEDIEYLQAHNLHVNPAQIVYESTFGNVIDRPGEVYVNGLYVCTLKNYAYGYDLKPEHLKIDRDRRIVGDFDLQYLTSRLWANSSMSANVVQMLKDRNPDVQYITSWTNDASTLGIADEAAISFIVEHGADAVPVIDTEELNEAVAKGHSNVVIVSSTLSSYIKSSSMYIEKFIKDVPRTPYEILAEFYDTWKTENDEEFEEILEQAKNWSVD